ncbi:MAG TPA: hypothetical protein V6D30_05600, partial [Leptolyngbyaceae cyanobacterium]
YTLIFNHDSLRRSTLPSKYLEGSRDRKHQLSGLVAVVSSATVLSANLDKNRGLTAKQVGRNKHNILVFRGQLSAFSDERTALMP